MERLGSVLRSWPRISSALAFAMTACALAILWWSPVIFEGATLQWLLFVGSPGLSALIAGALLGRSLLAVKSDLNLKRSALLGFVTASIALVIFAPLFSTIYVFTQPPTEHWDVLSLSVLVLIGSAAVIWWLVAIIGAAVGCLVSWIASR